MPATEPKRKKRKTVQPKLPEVEKPDMQMIALAEIEFDGQNPRLEGSTDAARVADLAESMKLNGQQQPVQVYEYPAGMQSNRRFLLAFGFRRCAAAKLNEWSSIAAVVKPMPLKSDGSLDRLDRSSSKHRESAAGELEPH